MNDNTFVHLLEHSRSAQAGARAQRLVHCSTNVRVVDEKLTSAVGDRKHPENRDVARQETRKWRPQGPERKQRFRGDSVGQHRRRYAQPDTGFTKQRTASLLVGKKPLRERQAHRFSTPFRIQWSSSKQEVELPKPPPRPHKIDEESILELLLRETHHRPLDGLATLERGKAQLASCRGVVIDAPGYVFQASCLCLQI